MLRHKRVGHHRETIFISRCKQRGMKPKEIKKAQNLRHGTPRLLTLFNMLFIAKFKIFFINCTPEIPIWKASFSIPENLSAFLSLRYARFCNVPLINNKRVKNKKGGVYRERKKNSRKTLTLAREGLQGCRLRQSDRQNQSQGIFRKDYNFFSHIPQ